ncbi:MAG: hypothetical protein AAF995_11125 [Planctomycetota bacterium]|mgnify:CR=1 FL=1
MPFLDVTSSAVRPALQRLQYTPPDLRAVPLLDRVLDEPLLWSAGLVVLGLIALWALNRSGKVRAGLVAAGAALLSAGGLLLADALRTSPRERVMDASVGLVDAVASGDADAADALFDPSLVVSAGRLPVPSARPVLLRAVESFPAQASLTGHRVSAVRASLTGPNTARSQVRVALEGDVPRMSWWQLDWVERSGAWRLSRLEPLWIVGFEDF